MKFAYADPPYYGCGRRYYGKHHPDAARWDNVDTHFELVDRLIADYPDGWALSCNSRDLTWLLPACPDTARVAAWVKPFSAGYKPGIRVSYSWEPVIWTGGRRHHQAGEPVTRDSLIHNTTTRSGLVGSKPAAFNRWILDLLSYQEGDQLDDLFPGTGGMAATTAQGVLL